MSVQTAAWLSGPGVPSWPHEVGPVVRQDSGGKFSPGSEPGQGGEEGT